MSVEQREVVLAIVEAAAGRTVQQLLDERGEQMLREAFAAAVERERAFELLTPEEAGRLLRTPAKTLKAWANEGRLQGVMIGRRRLFTRGAVLAFIVAAEDGTGRYGTDGRNVGDAVS